MQEPHRPLTSDPLDRRDAGSWLPWISLPAVLGAAGLVSGFWWWLALPALALAVIAATPWPWAARGALGLASLVAGAALIPAPGPPSTDHRLLSITGTVTGIPFDGWTQGVTVAVDAPAEPGTYGPRRLFVRLPGTIGLRPGDRLAARGLWREEPRGPLLVAVEAERLEARENGPRGRFWAVIDRLDRHRELAGALLMGRGDPPEKAAFRRTGLLHVLAVSGMHLAIAAGLMAWLLRQAGLGWNTRLVALGILVCGYTWLTGASPATVRALAMALAVIAYDATAREATRLGPLSLAALVLLLIDPTCARDLGFQLSLAAVLGILTFGQDLIAARKRLLPLAPWPLDRPSWRGLLWCARTMMDGLCVGLAATAATAPLLVLTFGSIAPLGVVTTLAAAPPATLALWAGLPLLGLGALWANGPWESLYRLVEWSLDGLVLVVRWADTLPGQVTILPPGPLTGAAVIVALVVPGQAWWWWVLRITLPPIIWGLGW